MREVDLALAADAEATLPSLIEAVKKLTTPERRSFFEARGKKIPSQANLTVTQSIAQDVIETLEAVEIPGNLPLQLTSFIGRKTELVMIKRLLRGQDRVRLLTLVGAGGCGKTRLALQVAEQLLADYPQGVWFVDLAPLTDPNLLPRMTAALFGLPEMQGQEITKSLVGFLRAKKILILFDNCELILRAVAELAEVRRVGVARKRRAAARRRR